MTVIQMSTIHCITLSFEIPVGCFDTQTRTALQISQNMTNICIHGILHLEVDLGPCVSAVISAEDK